MRVTIIQSGKIINIIEALDLDDAQQSYPGCQVRAALASEKPDSQPAVVPASVEMRQARLALLAINKLNAVNAALNALPEPDRSAALIDWEFKPRVHRDSAMIARLAPALGLSAAQLDQLFIAAAGL